MAPSYLNTARRRRGQRRCLAVLMRATLFLLFAATAIRCPAHQKWLWPNTFAVNEGSAWVSVDATWSDTPFTAESGLGEQELRVAPPTGDAYAPTKVFTGKTKTTFELELSKPGAYRLDAIDPATYWTQVERSGKKIWLKKPAKEVVGEKIVRSDLYWSIASAYVTVGAPGSDFPTARNDLLCLVPKVHPNAIAIGKPLQLTVYSRGKPLPGVVVKSFNSNSTGHKPLEVVSSNKEGVCIFEPKSPGLYLFACEWEQKKPNDPLADLHSYNAYLTINVLPEPR